MSQSLVPATQTSDHSCNTEHQERPFSEKKSQPVPGRDSMASNDPTKDSYSGSPTSKYEEIIYEEIYEVWRRLIIDKPKDRKTTGWNIYKVPFHLRKLNEEAYTPQLVSVGPIHHGQPNLNQMQEQKLRYLEFFWLHVNKTTEDMDKFKKFLEDEEDKIRKSYAENLCDKFNGGKLVEMMLLDSVFIMELFLRIQNVEKRTYPDDIIVNLSWLNKSIQRDLLLLENEIPLFILEELYSTFVPDFRKKHAMFIDLARDYFVFYHTYGKCDEEKKSSTGSSSSGEKIGSSDSKGEPPKHFTDLIRSFYICKDLNDEFKKGLSLKTATKLQEAGVSLKKVIDRPLLDINFKEAKIFCWFQKPIFKMVEARFEIPQLRIDHTTGSVLSNIMALEHCHYPGQPYVCGYVSLFNSLIHTKEDVSLLVDKGVIAHTLGSDTEVETLVHGLGRTVTNETCYKDMIDQLDSYCNRMWWRIWWNRSMVELRSVYFRDLWRASSAIIGLFVFMFAILNVYQTIRSFYVVKN